MKHQQLTFRLLLLLLALLEHVEVLLERHRVHVLAVVERLEQRATRRDLVLREQRVETVEHETALAVGEHEAVGEDLHEEVVGQHATEQTVVARETAAEAERLRHWTHKRGRARRELQDERRADVRKVDFVR